MAATLPTFPHFENDSRVIANAIVKTIGSETMSYAQTFFLIEKAIGDLSGKVFGAVRWKADRVWDDLIHAGYLSQVGWRAGYPVFRVTRTMHDD